MTKRKTIFLVLLILLQLGLIWPIYPLFSSFKPLVFGLPLSFAWIIFILFCCFLLVLWYYLTDPEVKSHQSKK